MRLSGLLNTPLVHKALTTVYGKEGDIATLISTRDAQCPMGHMGDAWDTAYAALYLASDEAKYVTGVELNVDGGMSIRFCKADRDRRGGSPSASQVASAAYGVRHGTEDTWWS